LLPLLPTTHVLLHTAPPLPRLSLLLPSPFFFYSHAPPRAPPSSPTRRSSDLGCREFAVTDLVPARCGDHAFGEGQPVWRRPEPRSEEHTSELQSLTNLVCRLLLEKKKRKRQR